MASPFVFILVAFIGFFIWNDFSVVLGDKEHHSICLHLMQICYFSVFFCISFVDEIVLKLYNLFKNYKQDRRPLWRLVLSCVLCSIIAA